MYYEYMNNYSYIHKWRDYMYHTEEAEHCEYMHVHPETLELVNRQMPDEKELYELKSQGLTLQQIGDKFGFSREQIKEYFKRERRKERKLVEGTSIKSKGRPRKDGTKLPPSVQQLSKLTQLQYELAMKERHIKRLEMENELMRDFLSLTERK